MMHLVCKMERARESMCKTNTSDIQNEEERSRRPFYWISESEDVEKKRDNRFFVLCRNTHTNSISNNENDNNRPVFWMHSIST